MVEAIDQSFSSVLLSNSSHQPGASPTRTHYLWASTTRFPRHHDASVLDATPDFALYSANKKKSGTRNDSF
jgi:hypothetical protein